MEGKPRGNPRHFSGNPLSQGRVIQPAHIGYYDNTSYSLQLPWQLLIQSDWFLFSPSLGSTLTPPTESLRAEGGAPEKRRGSLASL